jgi:hypothetical protein
MRDAYSKHGCETVIYREMQTDEEGMRESNRRMGETDTMKTPQFLLSTLYS